MKITIPNVQKKDFYKRILTVLNGETNFSLKQIEVLSVVLGVFEQIYVEAEEVPSALVKHLKSEIREACISKLGIRSSFLSSILEILKNKGVFDENYQVTEFYKRLVKSKISGDYNISFTLKVIDDVEPETHSHQDETEPETHESSTEKL